MIGRNMLGGGDGLWGDTPWDGAEVELESIGTVQAPGVTHVTYRVLK